MVVPATLFLWLLKKRTGLTAGTFFVIIVITTRSPINIIS